MTAVYWDVERRIAAGRKTVGVDGWAQSLFLCQDGTLRRTFWLNLS